jgi:hypothetical protein
MPATDELPQPAVALITYAETEPRDEVVQVLVEIVLASTHPDFVMSLATACLLPQNLREAISDYLSYTLLTGLNEKQRNALFSWGEAWMLSRPAADS